MSKYRGVSFFKPMNKWTATASIDGRRRVRYFKTEEEAAIGYDVMIIGARREKAITNFPIDGYVMPEKEKVEERIYEDRDVQINTAFIRSALNMWISKNTVSYRKNRVNWVIVSDLFFPDFKGEDPLRLCRELGIDPIGIYI